MMIENATKLINFTDLIGPQLSKGMNFLIKVGISVGIVIIIYVLFLIIKGFLSLRTSSYIKKIAKNLVSINEKMDVLIDALKKRRSGEIGSRSREPKTKQNKKIKKKK